MKEMVGGFGKVQEETVGVFTLVVIKPCHRPRVQELVKKPAAVSPSTPVTHETNAPGLVAHPGSLFVNDTEP